MTRTQYQTEVFAAASRETGGRAGVAQFATHTPTYLPPTSTYPDSPTTPTAGPSHRTAIIGVTGLALLLAAMGGIAYLRAQEAVVPTAVPVAATAVVPHGALAALDATVAVAPASGVVAVSVPHAALAEYTDSLSDAPAAVTVSVPRGAAPVE